MAVGPDTSLAAELSADGVLRRAWDRVRFEVLPGTFAIAFAMTLTLCVRGYQFGGSNHNVYLIDAMHQASGGQLLARDWFTTQTLQYHAVFGILTRQLFRWNIVEPAFLAGQLVCIFLMHLAWFRIVRRLGGTRMTYLLSVLMFYVLGGGVGLGMYEFMQDQAFLPSNIANVAMLWGMYFWISRKPGLAGLWLGVAGLFHLNHALVAIGLWGALNLWRMWDTWRSSGQHGMAAVREVVRSSNIRGFVIGTLLVLGISIGNIVVAAMAVWSQTRTLPMDEYVNLYVRLRHPHHYDPSTWPVVIWVTFVLPIPLAVWAAWLRAKEERSEISDLKSEVSDPPSPAYAWQQASRIFLLISALLVVALIGAGIFYVSETLVKLSLYRFSIYVKMLSCVGAAYLLYNAGVWNRRVVRWALFALPIVLAVAVTLLFVASRTGYAFIDWLAGFVWRHRGTAGLVIILCTVLAIYELIYAKPWRRWRHDLLHASGIVAMALIIYLAWGRWLGAQVLPDDDEQYLQVCRWVQHNTPVDAVFIVPPQEQSFRLHARRAIVINFKGVPQLNGEIPEWRDRLQAVLDLPDLTVLQRPTFDAALDAIQDRYNDLNGQHLQRVAHLYDADYILVQRPLPDLDAAQQVYPVGLQTDSGYYLYRVNRLTH